LLGTDRSAYAFDTEVRAVAGHFGPTAGGMPVPGISLGAAFTGVPWMIFRGRYVRVRRAGSGMSGVLGREERADQLPECGQAAWGHAGVSGCVDAGFADCSYE
jgi:hypothetical protein